MKTLIVLLAIVVILSCKPIKEIQIQEHIIILVKIDTTYRAGIESGLCLTWEDEDHERFYEFVPPYRIVTLGMKERTKLRR